MIAIDIIAKVFDFNKGTLLMSSFVNLARVMGTEQALGTSGPFSPSLYTDITITAFHFTMVFGACHQTWKKHLLRMTS